MNYDESHSQIIASLGEEMMIANDFLEDLWNGNYSFDEFQKKLFSMENFSRKK